MASYFDDVIDQVSINTTRDNVICPDVGDTIPGGKTLILTNFTEPVIYAGHPVIKETATGDYKPLPLTGAGGIFSLGVLTPGSGYTSAGTYENVSLTGGSGSGAKATIVVAGGAVTTVTITTPGSGYQEDDTLSASAANIGGAGSGFSIKVASVSLTATKYSTLPGGHTFEGICNKTASAKNPHVGVKLSGLVNYKAAYHDYADILSAIKTALPRISFRADKD